MKNKGKLCECGSPAKCKGKCSVCYTREKNGYKGVFMKNKGLKCRCGAPARTKGKCSKCYMSERPYIPHPIQVDTERIKNIIEMRKQKVKYREIGAIYGISRQRVEQIHKRAIRRQINNAEKFT